jgi:hypothetical protein
MCWPVSRIEGGLSRFESLVCKCKFRCVSRAQRVLARVWLVSRASICIQRSVGIFTCCYVMMALRASACVCTFRRPSTYQHAFGLVMSCICLCLQASRAADVSAYNGLYPHTHRAEHVSTIIGLYQGVEHEFAFLALIKS